MTDNDKLLKLLEWCKEELRMTQNACDPWVLDDPNAEHYNGVEEGLERVIDEIESMLKGD